MQKCWENFCERLGIQWQHPKCTRDQLSERPITPPVLGPSNEKWPEINRTNTSIATMTGSMKNEYICVQRIRHPNRAAFEKEN
jgi:hypothetical protein